MEPGPMRTVLGGDVALVRQAPGAAIGYRTDAIVAILADAGVPMSIHDVVMGVVVENSATSAGLGFMLPAGIR
jgi:hypothetical protein